jgi:acyl-CoA hydrolase
LRTTGKNEEKEQRENRMTREKAVCESRVEMAQVMFPPDANQAGNIHGGSIMKLIDTAAGIVAMRHCRTNVVTASMDRLDFYEPVFVGELVILRAAINYVGSTSMEVGVRVEAEDLMTGDVRHTNSAYLTLVSLGENRRPMPVPTIICQTEDEKRRFEEGRMRAQRRKELRKKRNKR